VTREFDPALVAALAHVIFGAQLHTQAREDTVGVLIYYGAFHAEPDEAKRDAFVTDLADAIDAMPTLRRCDRSLGKESCDPRPA
jgi:hypothetical protein